MGIFISLFLIEKIAQHGNLGGDASAKSGLDIRRKQWRMIRGQQRSLLLRLRELGGVGSSESEVKGWNAQRDENRIVFGGCFRWLDHHVLLAEILRENRAQTIGEGGVVVNRVGPLIVFDQRLAGSAAGDGFSFDDPVDCGENLLADVIFVGANGDAKFGLIGNDVVLCSGANITNGDDRDLAGLYFARNDRLQIEDGLGGNDNRVDGGMGRGPVAPLP